MQNSTDSNSIFTSVTEKLREIYSLPRTNVKEIKELLGRLEGVVQEVELIYGRHSVLANVSSVERAAIHGNICTFVKNSLLHGQWTGWAAANYCESLRTIEKWMAISVSTIAGENAHLGPDKVYQVTRVEHLLSENVTLPDLFRNCGLDVEMKNYTGKAMERAVTVILNKEILREQGVELPNEALHKLSDSFSLIRDNQNVLGRLCEAKSEEANLEKAVTNIIASGGRSSAKKRANTKKLKEDVNSVAERFIRSLQDAIEKPDTYVDENRLRFVIKLVTECLELRCK
jgi:hypothetical protein